MGLCKSIAIFIPTEMLASEIVHKFFFNRSKGKCVPHTELIDCMFQLFRVGCSQRMICDLCVYVLFQMLVCIGKRKR